jgi:RNA polymerase sigma factor (sigma-70 family)
MERLTVEQQKIVEENHDLIYWFLRLRKLDPEEYYDLLAIELCKTVMRHDPKKGSLSYLFSINANHCITKEIRKRKTKKRDCTPLEFLDELYISDHTLLEDSLMNELWIDEDMSGILKLRSEGYTQKEIGDKLGVSQVYISQLLQKMKKVRELNE